jgi:phosphinothricin acetyltransferase
MVPVIRLAADADAPAIAEIYRPSIESSVTSFEIDPPDSSEMRRRIRGTMPQHPWLVCDIAGRCAGYAYASKHKERAAYRWSVDVSVYIDRECQRRGVGRGLYTSLFAILRAQGYVNAYAGITLPNTASVGLHESLGFTPVAVYRHVGYKLGGWLDVGWWALALKRHDVAPAEPVDINALLTRPDWLALLAAGTSDIRLTT